MDVYELKVVKDFGKLSTDGYVYFRITNYCGNILYDIRGWRNHGETPFDVGIKLNAVELVRLYFLLRKAIKETIPKKPIHTLIKNGTEIKIYNYFGDVTSQGITLQFTYTQWGEYGYKYDLRHWEAGFSDCWDGVRMTDDECFSLFKILEKEF